MEYPIKVNYEYTDNLYRASKWLEALPDLFAADFETASRFNDEEKEQFKLELKDNNKTFEEKRILHQKINSNGLAHPSLTLITHLSVAWSDKDALVIICNRDSIRSMLLNFLTSTSKKQLWHNSIFDFKHIYYNTKLLPINYVDTQLLAKSILNDANPLKDNTRLKELMAYAYGDWAISKDDFTLEEMYKEYMLRYSAIDACATYKLYQDIMSDINATNR